MHVYDEYQNKLYINILKIQAMYCCVEIKLSKNTCIQVVVYEQKKVNVFKTELHYVKTHLCILLKVTVK